jgi:lipopolysaccharide assembly outer membrane protein LptD (OstA)
VGSIVIARRWVAGCLLVLCACNPVAPKPTPRPSNSPAPALTQPALHITASGTVKQPVRMFQQVHNQIEYELVASSGESQGPQGKAIAVFRNSTVTFHGRGGASTTARAPSATVDETANTVMMSGGVIAHSASGVTLQCDRLTYDHRTQMLHGTGNVSIVDQKGFRATGSSFDSDVSLTHMTMR